MGELLRRFWLPVLLSEELPEADGTPKKIVVMGEELLAFRDTRGVVGVIDQYCPHRGANLWLGRNEECGIRCVYHGWKFDTDGRCVDMPTSYPDLNAKDLIRIKSYPVREWGDMIWAYMGPADADAGIAGAGNGAGAGLAPLRHEEMAGLQLGAGAGRLDRHRAFHLRASELREGRERDPRHQEALCESADAGRDRPHALDRRGPAPGDQDQSARGRADDRRRPAHRHDNIYWRIAQFLMPVHAYAPSAMPGENIFGQSFVPVTDTNCWIYTYAWNPERPLTQAERDGYDRGNGVMSEVDENYMPLRNKANDYLIDRKLQKTNSYTGIKGVSEQDAAVQDSQGPIADRTREHLGPTDLGIMHFRKLVMDAARALQQGEAPPHLKHQDRYTVRSGACVTSKAKDLPAVMIERFGDPAGYVGGRGPRRRSRATSRRTRDP
jgi:phthalate 4,5-dioxygenase oxygenase subunit